MFGLSSWTRSRIVPTKNRGSFTSKNAPKGMNKGKGVKPTGIHTKKGGYKMDPNKVPHYEVPDLDGFQLKAYIDWNVPKLKTKKPLPEGVTKPIIVDAFPSETST